MCRYSKVAIGFLGLAIFLSTACHSFGFFQWEDYQPEPNSVVPNLSALDSNTAQRFKPLLGIEVGGIWLSRKTPDSQNLVFDQSNNVLSNANQLQGSIGSGLDTTLSFFNVFRENPVDFQMRFFQASRMTAEQTLTATSVVPRFYQGIPINPTASNELFYDSKVRSFEANVVYRTPFRIRFLSGLRYFEVDEKYNIIDNVNSQSGTFNGFFSRTDNSMIGGQIGAEGVLVSNENGRIFGSCKWALLGNDVTGSARAANSSGAPLIARASDSITSQLLDLQLGGSLGLSRCISIYGGYQGLVASDLGMVLEQNRNADIFAGTNPIFRSDGQWHGFKTNVVFAW